MRQQGGSQPKTLRMLLAWIVMSVVGLIFSGLLAGLAFQLISSSREEARLQPAGKLVEVSGIKLHVVCMGSRTSARTVIFENGLGVVSDSWTWIQASLSKTGRACAYDRRGSGYSDASPSEVDAGTAADDLAELLDVLGETEPVVIVGHSYGALLARFFAHRHPDRVAGLVLVDSAHEDMDTRFPPEAQG